MIAVLLRRCALVFVMFAGAVHAQDKAIVIDKAVARATVGKMPNGAAFLKLENRGGDDVLVSASSPAASKVEIHTMTMEGDVMKMRALEQLDIKAGQKLEMKPGNGAHLMLMGLKKPLVAGEKFPLTLNFRKAGKLETQVEVAEMAMPAKKEGGDMHEHEHHHHHD